MDNTSTYENKEMSLAIALKEGTKESHSAAENTKFVASFLRGVVDYEEYRKLLTNFYYVFWGVATTSVVLGQLYVGAGYRAYASALLRIFDSIEVEVNRGYDNRRFY